MSHEKWGAFGCAAAFIVFPLALFALVVLGPIVLNQLDPTVTPGPEPEPIPGPGPEPVPVETPDPDEPEEPEELPPSSDEYLPEVGSLSKFEKVEEGGLFRLSYGFIDHHGRRHEVTCTVTREDYERETAAYGYTDEDRDAVVGRWLRDVVAAEAERRGVGRYLRFEVTPGVGYKWEWNVPRTVELAEWNRVVAELNDLDSWLNNNLPGVRDALDEQYFGRRGFLLKGDLIEIDHVKLVDRATEPLRDCFDALWREGAGGSDRYLLGLFTAFYQELRYEIPPDIEFGRRSLGLRVPTAVLVKGAGDCDSKAVAFCAMWRHFQNRVIIIRIPGHALVGVEAAPGPDEAFVRLGNRYFVLTEVAGEGKITPGRGEPVSGSFEYVMIEPVR